MFYHIAVLEDTAANMHVLMVATSETLHGSKTMVDCQNGGKAAMMKAARAAIVAAKGKDGVEVVIH